MSTDSAILDPSRLRRVFGAFPTGVVAVAAVIDGRPAGMAASSFTSVSLDPALVSVCVAHTSTTWPVLAGAARIGISVLSAQQQRAGRQLAARNGDRFAELSWRATDDGAVFLDGASAWLDTSIDQHVRAGDHDIVVLRVHDLDAEHHVHPLVFHASEFRTLVPTQEKNDHR
ncbi:MAG TPA: flavin reductase family protein [Trebonia sp.]|jgi:flavin reductase (DIM6/NTAB) family NADH-FMN oxidoreductase RutF